MSVALRILRPCLMGALFVGATSASAMATTTATSTFQVSATVLPSCQISATGLSFGSYSGAALSATSTISVNCTQNLGYNIGLSGGSSGGTVASRVMAGPGGATLAYGLYKDANHTANWGETVGTDTEQGNGTGSAQTITVYGLLPASQQATAGSYTDTITATVTY